MILNYLLILAYANQKFLRGTRTKKSPSYLQTGNRLCHLNVLQGMSHLNDSPQVNFPSTSSSNIWGILFVFSEAISQGSDQMAQWNLHIRKRSWLQALADGCCPGHSQVTQSCGDSSTMSPPGCAEWCNGCVAGVVPHWLPVTTRASCW